MKRRVSLAAVLVIGLIVGLIGSAVAQDEPLGWRPLDVSGLEKLGTPFGVASDGAATIIVGLRDKGSDLVARAWSSPDGLSDWSKVGALSGAMLGLPDVTHGPAGFVASGMSAVHRSSDGSAWHEVARPGLIEATLTSTPMGYLVAGWLPRPEGGLAGVAVSTSIDGNTWSDPTLLLETGEPVVPGSVSLPDGSLIVVVPIAPEAGGPGVATFASTDDGVTWQRGADIPSLGGTPSLVRLGHGAGRVFAVVSIGDSPTAVLSSVDASEWTLAPALSGVAHVVGTLGDEVVALGDGIALSSVDGLEWTSTQEPVLEGAGLTGATELAEGRLLATGLRAANGSAVPAIWVGEPATVANSAARLTELASEWDAAFDRIWKGGKPSLKTLKKRARADMRATQRYLSGLRAWPWPEEAREEAEVYVSNMEAYQRTNRKLISVPDERSWDRWLKIDKAQRPAQLESLAALAVALAPADPEEGTDIDSG